MMSLLTLNMVSYRYDGTDKDIFKKLNVEFEAGKIYAIIGKSGVGKSTLLSLISGLDLATGGAIYYKQNDLSNLDRDHYRANDIGVIFQSYNLITNMTAVENIVLSMNIGESDIGDKKDFALRLLDQVGIDEETAKRKTLKLSGGQQQRVGIARAIAHHPSVIIADEPTGNLDTETEQEILEILEALAHEEDKCVIIVTHSPEVASIADVIFEMRGGKLQVC
ncbi:MAG: ABC transporter ATP-binding protein [Turicibacter sp.]|nr:ABC transporter ATP-binding protein [Turicibacter sp.]